MKTLNLILAFVCIDSLVFAQTVLDSLKSYTTAHIKGAAPHIDGNLNDPVWDEVPWAGGDFIQSSPNPGKPASVQTKFKILYDSKNLYIAFKNLDPNPDKITSRMTRRDGFEGDWVEINIDSYYDKRTAFSFTPSVSGVKGDQYVSNNGDNWDQSWDPIWYLKTSIDAEGWVAELRIPLSQLRFADKDDLIWGIEVSRFYYKNQEISLWQYIAPDASGWVHRFGELNGIHGIRPQQQLEIQPYAVTKTETFEPEEGNPFMTGRSSGFDAGLDAKIGITSDITLDLTVNPDFGQVEADPSQVNLSAFELFFQERRPFFIEGNNTLNFPVSDFNSNNLFYSRRLGRPPQGSVETDEDDQDDGVDEFSKAATRTTILGAAKLTGKNKNGFSWGILETVTSLEKAKVDSIGFRSKQVVEPMTNYFVTRAQQDINKGNTVIGAMLTATNRKIEQSSLDWLHKDAYSGGLDLMHNFNERKYYFSAKTMMSHVRGSTEAITTTQESSERYFQRPDNDHADVDPDRRSLTGTAGMLRAGKRSGKIISDVGVSWTSPELELNDIGFLAQTDNISQFFWMQYRILNPGKITRWQRYNINQWEEMDFDFKNTSRGYNTNAHAEFKNFWQVGGGVTYQVHTASNADLRGGPAMNYPGYINYWMYVQTDRRKKFFAFIGPQYQSGFNNYNKNFGVDFDFVYRPVNALSISISPSINHNNNHLQYVTTEKADDKDRYLMAEIDQTTIRVSIRVTYMITPNLSLQYYGQPFGTSGDYTNYKYITNGSASYYEDRFQNLPASSFTTVDDQYQVDENGDGQMDYNFDKPDFNFGQFRSNMVLRWEYIPGSVLFLVWNQEQNGSFYDHDPGHDRYSFEFKDKPHNIFVFKFAYRFVF
jgi:hypothetical protein